MRLLLATRIVILLLGFTLTDLLLLETGEACFQAHGPSVQLRAEVIAGIVTLDGKAIDGAVLSLHKFLGAYAVESGHADSHALSEAVTAKDGTFRFSEVPSGKYVVVMSMPSHEFTNVQLIRPRKGENDTVAIEYFADFCASAAVISADGRRLTRSVPDIIRRRRGFAAFDVRDGNGLNEAQRLLGV